MSGDDGWEVVTSKQKKRAEKQKNAVAQSAVVNDEDVSAADANIVDDADFVSPKSNTRHFHGQKITGIANSCTCE
jgi:hypothetical protein